MTTGIGIGTGIGFIPKEIEGAYEPILDTLPSAVYAGSLRLLRTAYTGPVVELQRSGATDTDDFFSVNDELENAAGQSPTDWLVSLGALPNAGLRIRTLYNQSAGAASDLTQPTQSLQPHLWQDGAPDYYRIGANNRITLHWDNYDDALISSGFAGYPNVSCFVVEELLPTEPAHLLIQGVSTGYYRIVSETGAVTSNVAGAVYVNGVPTGSTTRGQLYTDIQGVYNGTGVGAIASQFIDFDMPLPGYATWYLNKYASGSYFSNSCKIAELIMYPADMSSSITAISNNQRSYYGI
jgi:hypothetical protein